MKDHTLKIIFGFLSLFLLISLVAKLTTVSGGLILSGLFLGCMFIVAIVLGCFIIALILKSIFNNHSFLTLYFITTVISFLVFHYYLFSPTLTIVVPKGYTGEVNLVLSNVEDNVLKLDSTGIGYTNKWTFQKTYTEPIVMEPDGTKINDRCIGFNPSSFWGLSTVCCAGGKVIRSKSFEIVPEEKKGMKQYYSKDLTGMVDTAKLYGEQ